MTGATFVNRPKAAAHLPDRMPRRGPSFQPFAAPAKSRSRRTAHRGVSRIP